MSSVPFRLVDAWSAQPAGSAGAYGPLVDLCCARPERPQPDIPRRRAKLSELDPHLHCSVIGTCLATGELRRLVARFVLIDRERASDLEVHHEAVKLAMDGGGGAKALHKALDARYEGAIKRLQPVRDADALLARWEEALKSGEVPGAYWAVMTHPDTTPELRQRAFGDVHMLSHLVGAANRADVRRLQALEAENGALKDKIDRQQQRLNEMGAERERLSRQLSEQVLRYSAHGEHEAPAQAAASERIEALTAELAARNQALAHHTGRREAAERQLEALHEMAQQTEARLRQALSLVDALQAEVQAMEETLDRRWQAAESAADANEGVSHGGSRGAGGSGDASLTHAGAWHGRRFVYVGGRPKSSQMIKALAEAAGAELMVHDGGIEDRKGLLTAMLPGADLVVFPVDCIDHDSMSTLKRICERHGIAYHPLRSASAASFAALLASLGEPSGPQHSPQPPASRFCLRHG